MQNGNSLPQDVIGTSYEEAYTYQNTVTSTPIAQTNQEHNTMSKKSTSKSLLIFAIVAIIAGVATGYGGSMLTASENADAGTATSDESIQKVAGDSVKKGDVFGSQNSEAFKDTAEGYLESGGLDGEGSHSLLRPGGETQTVYLTSSITDLDKLVGMEVKVWGETFKGQKAGWLMDVGRIEIVDTKGTPPTEK